jgi:hypothetical protein
MTKENPKSSDPIGGEQDHGLEGLYTRIWVKGTGKMQGDNA